MVVTFDRPEEGQTSLTVDDEGYEYAPVDLNIGTGTEPGAYTHVVPSDLPTAHRTQRLSLVYDSSGGPFCGIKGSHDADLSASTKNTRGHGGSARIPTVYADATRTGDGRYRVALSSLLGEMSSSFSCRWYATDPFDGSGFARFDSEEDTREDSDFVLSRTNAVTFGNTFEHNGRTYRLDSRTVYGRCTASGSTIRVVGGAPGPSSSSPAWHRSLPPVQVRAPGTAASPTARKFHDVQMSQGQRFFIDVRRLFIGDYLTYSAESSDDEAATATIVGSHLVLTVTATPDKSVLVRVHDPCFYVDAYTFTCAGARTYYLTAPYQRHETTVTATATNDTGSATVHFTVTVFLDPN